MALTKSQVGELSRIFCAGSFGYTSDSKRPAGVPKDAALVFEVELVRWEKEVDFGPLPPDEKLTYMIKYDIPRVSRVAVDAVPSIAAADHRCCWVFSRKNVGNELFAAKKYQSACKQYSKVGLSVLYRWL